MTFVHDASVEHGIEIDRLIAEANRGKTDWEVEGLTLPPFGYLITGPNGFRQYRARKADDTVDVVLGRTHGHHTLGKVGGDFV